MSVVSESFIFDLIIIIITILVGITTYCKRKLSYWTKIGLPTLPTTVPFGNTKSIVLGHKTLGEEFRDLYREFKRIGFIKHAGVYFGTRPFYLTIDPELIKNVLQKDFRHFVNHVNYKDEEDDPLSGHLFNLEDAKWRNMRVKLTPTFTSGKMKMMFQTLVDCTVGLKDIMDEAASRRSAIDIKEILGRFTTDITGSAAFGLDCNSLKDPDAVFRKYGKKIFEFDGLERIKILLPFMVPHSILRMLKIKITKSDVEEFFIKVVRDTVEYREKNNIFREDFMHLLLQLKNRGVVKNDENGHKVEKALSMNELSAQAFVYFAAGFEMSSTTMTFALYELATNHDVQDKLREEIHRVLAKYDNRLTYEGIREMTYMDKILQETLRKHPPVSVLTRKCTQDYKVPDTSIVLKKGTDVAIPVLGLHTDPDYYPDPNKFDPERFSEGNKNSRHAFTWIPFGQGPRVCIGLRFGLLQSKVGLTTLLSNYKFKLSNKTLLPLTLSKNVIITTAAGGIWLEVEKLN